jgi:anaerobic magnesium-protoporphyrin IX monomethyl ester cyclase
MQVLIVNPSHLSIGSRIPREQLPPLGLLCVKFIELVLQARPKALWRSYFQNDRAARHGMNWFTRMGRRVLLHEWWNFFFCDRRVKNGPTLEQFWGTPQDHQEIPLRIQSQEKLANSFLK